MSILWSRRASSDWARCRPRAPVQLHSNMFMYALYFSLAWLTLSSSPQCSPSTHSGSSSGWARSGQFMYQIRNEHQCCFHHAIALEVSPFLAASYPSQNSMRRVDPCELWNKFKTQPQLQLEKGKKKGGAPAPTLPLLSVRPLPFLVSASDQHHPLHKNFFIELIFYY